MKRVLKHRLSSVATQRMYGKSSAKFKSSREDPCVWLNSHYHTTVLQKKPSAALPSQQKRRLAEKSAKPALSNTAEMNTNRQTCLDENEGPAVVLFPSRKKSIQSHNRFCTLFHCNLTEGSRPFCTRRATWQAYEWMSMHTNPLPL